MPRGLFLDIQWMFTNVHLTVFACVSAISEACCCKLMRNHFILCVPCICGAAVPALACIGSIDARAAEDAYGIIHFIHRYLFVGRVQPKTQFSQASNQRRNQRSGLSLTSSKPFSRLWYYSYILVFHGR